MTLLIGGRDYDSINFDEITILIILYDYIVLINANYTLLFFDRNIFYLDDYNRHNYGITYV